MVLKSDFVSIDRFLEGMLVEWKINVKVFSDLFFIFVLEELILLYRIFMMLLLRVLLLNIIWRFCLECVIVLIVCIVINLRVEFGIVRKEKIVCKKMGYCWVIFIGLDCVR